MISWNDGKLHRTERREQFFLRWSDVFYRSGRISLPEQNGEIWFCGSCGGEICSAVWMEYSRHSEDYSRGRLSGTSLKRAQCHAPLAGGELSNIF